jgi:hypothetical protein
MKLPRLLVPGVHYAEIHDSCIPFMRTIGVLDLCGRPSYPTTCSGHRAMAALQTMDAPAILTCSVVEPNRSRESVSEV